MRQPFAVADRFGGEVERYRPVGGAERFQAEVEHAVVDQPDEAEPLRQRDELARRNEHPVGAFEAEEALLEAGLARPEVDDRLEGEAEPLFVEGTDQLARERRIAAPALLAHRRMGVGHEMAMAA